MLVVRDLACRRGPRLVLSGVDLSLGAGGALLLRGANGAGKTTLLRTLAGLAAPARGEVAPERVAYCGHADGLKGQLTVGENLLFWARMFGGASTTPAVEAFALSPLLARRAADLSAGQRRRVGLARLPLTHRPIWLLDEPTVSLDEAGIAALGQALAAHRAGGGAVVVAAHGAIDLPGAAVLDVARHAPEERADGDPFTERIE